MNRAFRPFLKWAGGKRQLLPELVCRVPQAERFAGYHEPFLGGGALFFALFAMGRLGEVRVFLSDSNRNLIDTYRGVKENADEVIRALRRHKDAHCKGYYCRVRAEKPGDLFQHAARIIYLNRTCFNGLYRENGKGEFNVPFGDYVNPAICDETNLRAAAEALGGATIETRSFESVLDKAKPGDFVYFDPPYHPVSKTSSFTRYEKNGFGEDEQRRLAEVFAALANRGVRALLSNSMTPFVLELYRDFRIETVAAARCVNSKGSGRGKVPEALVRNY